MDRDAARARLRRMVRPDEFPALEADDLEDLLDQARRSDINGLLPDDTAWGGAYDLNAAAAEGFRWKAARVAGDASFSADGASFDRAGVVRNLLAQAAAYQAEADRAATTGSAEGAIGSIRVRSPLSDDYADICDDDGPWHGLPVANL